MKILSKLKYLLIAILLMILLYDSGNRHRQQVTRFLPANLQKSDTHGLASMMLGGFGGLAADIIFLKCVNLQVEKKYDDIPALAEWLVTLQPDYTDAVRYWSSNLAWNISGEHGDYALRWQWVQYGIHLIKDVALPLNNEPEYHLQMSQIYRMRIAEVIEPADVYFKTMLAREMQSILGDSTMENLSESPNTIYELNEYLGDGRFEQILKYYGITEEKLYDLLKSDTLLPKMGISEFEAEKVDQYLRRRWLKEATGIDAMTASEVDRIYGVLDWRMADSLAVYWAYTGKMRALELGRPVYRFERMISRALMRVMRNGTLFYVTEKGVLQTAPNFKVADALSKLYPILIEKYKKSEKMSRASYRRFLTQSISLFFAYGDENEALNYFKKYQRSYPEDSKGQTMQTVALDILAGMSRNYDYRAAQSLITGLYTRMFEFVGKGETEKAFALDRTAAKVWNNFKLNPKVEFYEKDKLPPLKEIKRSVYRNLTKTLPRFINQEISKPSRQLQKLMN